MNHWRLLLCVGNNRRDDAGCMRLTDMQIIFCDHRLGRKFEREWFSRVRVWLVERRSRAGDRDSNAMAFIENLAQPTDIEFHFCHFTRLEKDLVIVTFAVAGPANIIHDQD